MSRRSPVYVREIETGRHVKNDGCNVEIKIKWMMRKQMTYENIYRDDMYNVQDYSILYNKVLRRLHVRVGILLTTANNCMTPSFYLEGRVWAHKTSLIPSLFIEVPVPSQESKWSYICVRCVDFASIYTVQDIWKIDKNCVWFMYKDIFMKDISYALVMIYVKSCSL